MTAWMDMRRMRRAAFAAALFAAAVAAPAQRVVYDARCFAAAQANTDYRVAADAAQNAFVKKFRKAQDSLRNHVLFMAAAEKAYKNSLSNVSGFREESGYYKEIGQCARDILGEVPGLLSAIGAGGMPGMAETPPPGGVSVAASPAACWAELASLADKTRQLVADYADIVCNGRAGNPLGDSATAHAGDGQNLLSRLERLETAKRIYGDLSAIRVKVRMLARMARAAGRGMPARALDPQGWRNAMSMRTRAEEIGRLWRGMR